MANQYRTDEQLQAWIAETRRNQQRLAVGLVVGAVIAVVAWQLQAFAGKLLALAVVATAICGFWITSSHIADWRAQLHARKHGRPKV